MEKSKTFTITKDFGSKTLSKVFVREKEKFEINISIKERLFEAVKNSQTVCLVAENPVDKELMEVLRSVRENSGLRIYAIEPKLSEVNFALLKNNSIVREVPEIKGNYLLCDLREAFFYDVNLNGFCLNNLETVEKLHNYFIYHFWNKATKEYVSEIKTVAEQTFDVAPVSDSKELLINQNALFDNADAFCLPKVLPDFAKNKADDTAFYLSKNVIEKNRDWLLKEKNSKFIYTDSLSVQLCKAKTDWYIMNDDFAVLMEKEPAFGSYSLLKDVFSYKEAVGKDVFTLKDFSPVLVEAVGSENKSITVDYKTFKHIARMSENERIELFEKKNLLQSDKLAASVEFSILMNVRKLSKDAKPAPVYSEYENFQKAFTDSVKKIEKDIYAGSGKIKNYKNELDKINLQIEDFRKQKKDCSKFKKQLADKQELLASEIKYVDANKLLLEKSKVFTKNFDNIEDCQKAIGIFAALKSNIPDFDKPKFGILYKTKTDYEYVLNSSEDLEKAEEEMQAAKIKDVKFVDSLL